MNDVSPRSLIAPEPLESPELDRRRAARSELRLRHSESLARLLAERADLHGVHPLADFVADSVRWTA